MSRAGYRVSAAVICTALILLACIPQAASASPPEVVPLWGPYLTAASETGITVNWRTERARWGTVFYATADYYDEHGFYSNFILDTKKELHHVQLTGLTPGTTYHYCLRVGGRYTADHTFTTFGSEAFTFIVYGDSQEQLPAFTQLERHKLVADRIAEEDNVLFILHAGDLVGDVNNPEEWERFFQAARQVLAETPIFPVPGNHEENSPNYYDTFGMPQWYSFDCSNAHFAMMDSNSSIAVQADWLAQDLSGNAGWKFAVFHHPPYSSNTKNWGGWTHTRTAWEAIFVESGLNAVFNGHVHAYERYYENGIHYAVLGTGGGPCYALAEEKIDGYRNSLENTLGYARVTVSGSEAFMEIIKVAEVSGDEITLIYPPDTVFERVSLKPELPPANASLTATANLIMPVVGIDVDPGSIDYGDIAPGESSAVEVVSITNTGNVDCDVTLEVDGADATAQEFYELSLYIDGSLYDIATVIASIDAGDSQDVDSQLQVPLSWDVPGEQEATFIFWAEAP